MRQKWKVIETVVVALSIRISAANSQPAILEDKIVRTYEDDATGNKWVLERNAEYPGGPGRFIMTTVREPQTLRNPPKKPALVIRAGEKVTVGEKNASVTACLEGVALSSAAIGEALKVRLAVGGWLVRVIAEAPGKARLVGEAK